MPKKASVVSKKTSALRDALDDKILSDSENSGAPEFLHDHRSNPSLHLLYIHGAAHDLSMIDRMLGEINRRSRTPLSSLWLAIRAERDKLVKEEAAYHDADTIIKEYKKGLELHGNQNSSGD